MTEVSNWVKDRRPITYPLDVYDRRGLLKSSKHGACFQFDKNAVTERDTQAVISVVYL